MPLTDIALLAYFWAFAFLFTLGLLWPWRNRGVTSSGKFPTPQPEDPVFVVSGGVGYMFSGKDIRVDDPEADRRRYDLGAGQ